MFKDISLSKVEYAFDSIVMGYAGYHIATGRYDCALILAVGMIVTWAIRSAPSATPKSN